MSKASVLFICTGNAIRSQMAEAYLRLLSEGEVEVESAGVSPAGIHPLTRAVLEEDEVPLIGQNSKSVADVNLSRYTYIVTLCGHARDACPDFPSESKHTHWPIDDPIGFLGNEQQRLQRFRITREEIRDRVSKFLEKLEAD